MKSTAISAQPNQSVVKDDATMPLLQKRGEPECRIVAHIEDGCFRVICDIAVDSIGNRYVVGGAPHSDGNKYATSDMIVCKYDSSGEFVWKKTYHTTGYDITRRIIITDLDDIFLAGSHNGMGCLMKINENGDEIWLRHCNLWSNEYGEDCVLSQDGYLYICGLGQGHYREHKIAAEEMASGVRGFIAKYSLEGDCVWLVDKKSPSGTELSFNSICTDSKNNIYTLGIFRGNSHNGKYTKHDISIIKWKNNGEIIWEQSIEVPSEYGAISINCADNDDIYVLGHVSSDIDGDGPEKHLGMMDIFIAKYMSDGTRGWIRQIGTDKQDYPTDFIIYKQDQILILSCVTTSKNSDETSVAMVTSLSLAGEVQSSTIIGPNAGKVYLTKYRLLKDGKALHVFNSQSSAWLEKHGASPGKVGKFLLEVKY